MILRIQIDWKVDEGMVARIILFTDEDLRRYLKKRYFRFILWIIWLHDCGVGWNMQDWERTDWRTKAIPGEYPLVTTGEDRKSHNECQFDGEAVCIPLVSSTGHGHASIKRIQLSRWKIRLNILAAAIPNDMSIVSTKYLYFYLNNFKDDVVVPLMKELNFNVTLSIASIKN